MKINRIIDHTALKADTTKEQIGKLISEAKEYNFKSVCVNPIHVNYCAKELANTEVEICTVIGFPLGANTSEVKAFETKNAVENGATEIDMVINVGAIKDNNWELVEEDIKAVVNSANNKTVKVIFETCLLTKEEIKKAAEVSVAAGAHFVKTSTGFSTGGATVEDVKLMKDTVGSKAEVKASGGVRSLEDVEKMVDAGATRIGASSGVAIMNGLKSDSSY